MDCYTFETNQVSQWAHTFIYALTMQGQTCWTTYILNESLTFYSQNLPTLETKFNSLERNIDGLNEYYSGFPILFSKSSPIWKSSTTWVLLWRNRESSLVYLEQLLLSINIHDPISTIMY